MKEYRKKKKKKGRKVAALERLGSRASLKGIRMVVMREGQVVYCFFIHPKQIYPARPGD